MKSTPVLLLVFNRPQTTKLVFDQIRHYQPENLFVSFDGPRHKEDALKQQQIDHILDQIDWKCNLKINKSIDNLGCRQGVANGINWFFSFVDKGIILEDDCLPSQSFFKFASYYLKKYDNTDIYMISGNNLTELHDSNKIFYTKYAIIWGWATWKSKWQCYKESDYNIGDHKVNYVNRFEKNYWENRLFEVTAYEKVNTWDYYWGLSIADKKGICIVPGVNMIMNIGNEPGGTHENSLTNLFEIEQKEWEINFENVQVEENASIMDNHIYKAFIRPGRVLRLTKFYKIVRKLRYLILNR